jgi:GNAT superfamily N-acetyltransferase
VDVAARPATVEDLDVLGALADAVIAELEPMRGGAIWRRHVGRHQPTAGSLEAALADPDQLVLAGTIDGAVLGYGVVRVEPLRDGGRLGMIEDLFVDPEARGVGVGEAMMDLVLAWCSERGCVGVDALALPGHRDTKNFFESFGLVARAIVVHRSLDGPAS